MSNTFHDNPGSEQGNQQVSASKRRLLAAAIKSTPYALTLASGSSLANASAFQCIQNNRDMMFISELSGEHAVVEHYNDHWMRRNIEEFSVSQKHEALVEDENNPGIFFWDTQELITYTIYIPQSNTPAEEIWFKLTNNRLVPFSQELPGDVTNPEGTVMERYSWVGPTPTNGRVKGIIFFEPNSDDTGLTGSYRYHPFRDFQDIDESAYQNAPGTPTSLTQTCLCSVDPGSYGNVCL